MQDVGCITTIPVLAIVTGSILAAGVVVSYGLQIINIARTKSSEGLSALSLALAMLSNMLTLVNFAILNWNTRMACCFLPGTPFGLCLTNNLTTMQLGFGGICTFVLYILFIVYFPLEPQNDNETVEDRRKQNLRSKLLLAAVIIIIAVLTLVGTALHYWLHLEDSVLAAYGKIVGLISAVIVFFQWSPQIYTTWKMEDSGSLSIPMLLLQLPGCLSTIFFQAVLDNGDVTTWLPYFVTAVQEAILIFMCLVFYCKKKRGINFDELEFSSEEDDTIFSNKSAPPSQHGSIAHDGSGYSYGVFGEEYRGHDGSAK